MESAVVAGIMVRTKARTDPKYLDTAKSDVWEVPVIEVKVAPDGPPAVQPPEDAGGDRFVRRHGCLYSTVVPLLANCCRLCGATNYRRMIERDELGQLRLSDLYQCSGCAVVFATTKAWRGDDQPSLPPAGALTHASTSPVATSSP